VVLSVAHVVSVIVVPVVPVVSVADVPAVLVSDSDYRNNRKYHRAIHSYISINGDKHCRNNCH
jgi:hypothetical protein